MSKFFLTVIFAVCFFARAQSQVMPVMIGQELEKLIADGFVQAVWDTVTGELNQGPFFKLGEIHIQSPQNFSSTQLGLALFKGERATSTNLNLISQQIRNYLMNNGYPFAEVKIDFSTAENIPILELSIEINSGEGFKYGGLKYSGSRILPMPLERLSLLTYGETFSQDRVSQAVARLSRTGYFETLIPGKLFRDSNRNLIYPTVLLSDLKGNRFSGILGYDSEQKSTTGINGFMDIHLINLRGTARDLDFNFESKQTGQAKSDKEAHFVYTEPWIYSTPIGVKFQANISLEDSVYDERSYGLEFFQDLDFHSRYLVSLAQQFNHDFQTASRSSADIAGLGFLFDARDRVPFTLNGIKLSTRVNGLHRDLGDSSYFLVQNINEFFAWKHWNRWVGYIHISESGNWPLQRTANRGEQYELGGANSIRGFREKEFLTNLFLYGNFEIQYLLAPRSRAAIFVVPAFINHLSDEIDWQRKVGYGVGIESGTKDWSFGISYALNPDRDLVSGFLHMSVTNHF